MSKVKGGVLVTVALLCTACGISETRKKGEVIGEMYFVSASKGDVDQMLTLYDDDFYQASSRTQWSAAYDRIRTRLGRPVAHRLHAWQVNSVANTNGSGEAVTLVYDVNYERATGTEMLLVFFPRGSDAGGIRGHHFESEALLK